MTESRHNDKTICAIRLAETEKVRRVKLLEELLYLREERKCAEVLNIYRSVENNWNQTLHIMLLRAMGGGRNLWQLETLSRRATANICFREASSPKRLEALLLGTSGLLQSEFYDDYIIALNEEFDFLARKYSLVPMRAGEWERCRTFPAGNPVLRLAQAAALVASPAVRFDNLIRCSSREELHEIFDVTASEYWRCHYRPDTAVHAATGRLGAEKIDSMGINLVVPLMFAAATENNGEQLRNRAVALLEALPPEHNSKVASWSTKGVRPDNAFDTQALLEQSRYCGEMKCAACPLAKQLKIATFTD